LYIAVSNEPNNQFLEQSLIAASSMLFDKEDYSASLEAYEKLEKVSSNDVNKLIALKGQRSRHSRPEMLRRRSLQPGK